MKSNKNTAKSTHKNDGHVLKTLPKAELHLHLEGTLTPELMFKLAKKNNVDIPYQNIEEVRQSYNFADLKSFLDIYYQATKVLVKEEDFYELTDEYLASAFADGVTHVEVFFDPQSHLERGVDFETFFSGIYNALQDGVKKYKISFFIVMSFLRHLPESDAFKVLEMSLPYKDKIIAVGLDSFEHGNPPEKFTNVFSKAISHGYLTVAHAGEEGPPSYIWGALQNLKVERIDHGVRCCEDKNLMEYLAKHNIPLTVCPISNVKLGVFDELESHNLKELFDNKLCITINSDDPAFFGGTLLENYIQVYEKLPFSLEEMRQLAKNSFTASFLDDSRKKHFVDLIDRAF